MFEGTEEIAVFQIEDSILLAFSVTLTLFIWIMLNNFESFILT